MCIESDGVAANFSARQQLVRSACRERNEPLAKARSDANSGLDGGSAIFRHFKLESATENRNLMGIDQRGVDGVRGPRRGRLITEPPAGEHFENLE